MDEKACDVCVSAVCLAQVGGEGSVYSPMGCVCVFFGVCGLFFHSFIRCVSFFCEFYFLSRYILWCVLAVTFWAASRDQRGERDREGSHLF